VIIIATKQRWNSVPFLIRRQINNLMPVFSSDSSSAIDDEFRHNIAVDQATLTMLWRNLLSITGQTYLKHSCSSAISTLKGVENKRWLQTSIDNAWSNKNFLYYLTFSMLQHISSELISYNCYKHLKIHKKEVTGDKIKNNDKIDTTDSINRYR